MKFKKLSTEIEDLSLQEAAGTNGGCWGGCPIYELLKFIHQAAISEPIRPSTYR